MSTLHWIIIISMIMTAASLVGSVILLLPEDAYKKLILPLVSLACGTLIGGALFHLLPEAIEKLGNVPTTYLLLAIGFVVFFVLEQFLHWHHCHFSATHHHPVSYLVLVADGLHNFIDGIAVGSAFMIETRLGIITSVVALLHELPQELGDFGILINSGWKPRSALLFNLISQFTFLAGALMIYFSANAIDSSLFLPFAAGNFLYIGAADLIPQLKSDKAGTQLIHFTFFLVGIAIMFSLTATAS